MLLASAVVVWEWLNEHGRWRPYSPAVCHHIEAVIRSDPRCGSVVLGQVDSRLSRPTSSICIPCTSSDKTQVRGREERERGRHTAEGGTVKPGLRWRPFYCSCVSTLSLQAFLLVQLQKLMPWFECFDAKWLLISSTMASVLFVLYFRSQI